jgi:hypothetical protein
MSAVYLDKEFFSNSWVSLPSTDKGGRVFTSVPSGDYLIYDHDTGTGGSDDIYYILDHLTGNSGPAGGADTPTINSSGAWRPAAYNFIVCTRN